MLLPNAVLFPRVLMPLHIFEVRYRNMLADSLATNRMFAVALRRREQTPPAREARPHPVAGLGVIRASVEKPDGTSNLILEGLARIRINHFLLRHPDRGYPVAQIEPVASVEPAGACQREPLRKTIRQLVRLRARAGRKVPRSVVNTLLAVPDLALFSDLTSYTLLEDDLDKQLMLETLRVEERADRLLELLQKQIRRLELWKTLQGGLTNDDVGIN